jgi:hypothetical protein
MWRYVMVYREGSRTIRRLSDRTYPTSSGAAAAAARWAEQGPARNWGVQEGTDPGDQIIVGEYVVTCDQSGQPAHCTCPGFMYSKPHICRHLEQVQAAA